MFLEEELFKKVMVLSEMAWEGKVRRPAVERWLENFTGDLFGIDQERAYALFWLSNFMYYGAKEVRALLRAMYRDVFLAKISNIVDEQIGPQASKEEKYRLVCNEIDRTAFLGLGNPSESGVHLLYYFRQENKLPKKQFINARDIFLFEKMSVEGVPGRRNVVDRLKNESIKNYVFIDDLCGSGDQLVEYSKGVVDLIRDLNNDINTFYISMFASKEGIKRGRNESSFSYCNAVYELEPSYRALERESRYLRKLSGELEPQRAAQLVRHYGDKLAPDFSEGWKSSQMLLGFSHNVPDNCPAIIWFDTKLYEPAEQVSWTPIFRRYHKS